MASGVVRALNMLKKGEFKHLFIKILNRAKKACYVIRARFEDWCLGGVSIEHIIPSKFKETGAKWTQSTDYRLLDRAFKTYPLKENDVFVDVGCGEGRVLTYLYLRGIKNKLIGIELDPDVAETARKRTKKCANIEIISANILECEEIISNVTSIYLFNPFDEKIMSPFIQMIEDNCHHDIVLYYLNDRHRYLLDKRDNWKILRRDIVHRPCDLSFPYSIYKYHIEN